MTCLRVQRSSWFVEAIDASERPEASRLVAPALSSSSSSRLD